MLRQVSSRNQRSKGVFKMKNAVQICLLVVVCLWLLNQMKHSHDKKSFEERASRLISISEENEVENARSGRKFLPDITERNPARKSQKDEDEKEKLKTVRQIIKHENEDKKGGINDQEIDAKDQGRTAEGASLQEGKDREGGAFEDQEHDDASHEAREKSFRGDDASSEVFHNSHIAGHEEASHEAQERRFNGDDASSAVEHIIRTKESESAEDGSFKGDSRSNIIEHFTEDQESESAEERSIQSDDGSSVLGHFAEEKEFESENGARNLDEKLLENIALINREAEDTSRVDSAGDSSVELLDTFEGSNSGPSKGKDGSLDRSITTANITFLGVKEQEFDPNMLEEISASGEVNNNTVIEKEQHSEVKAKDTKHHIHARNSIDNRIEIGLVSMADSKDQYNLQINSSALSQGQIRAEMMLANVTSQAQNENIIIPGENFSLQNNVSEVTDVPQKSDISSIAEELVKTSKAPSATNGDGKAILLETNIALPSGDQKEAQRR